MWTAIVQCSFVASPGSDGELSLVAWLGSARRSSTTSRISYSRLGSLRRPSASNRSTARPSATFPLDHFRAAAARPSGCLCFKHLIKFRAWKRREQISVGRRVCGDGLD